MAAIPGEFGRKCCFWRCVEDAEVSDKPWPQGVAARVKACTLVPVPFIARVALMTQSRETKLMLAVKSGDLSAFEQLVERYQDMVYGLALSMLRSPEDAEEAAQDAFVKLFRARDQFDATKEVEPWLLRIAGNACRDRLRRRKTLGNLPVLRDESAQELANQIADPSVVGESVAAMRQLIRSELDRLSETARLPLELKYHRGLTNAQIAEALGMSLSNVKVQLARAKDILASRLGKVLEA